MKVMTPDESYDDESPGHGPNDEQALDVNDIMLIQADKEFSSHLEDGDLEQLPDK